MSAPAGLATRYAADGFYSPLDVLSREEAGAAYSRYQQYVNRYGVGGILQGDTRYQRSEDVCAVPNRLGVELELPDLTGLFSQVPCAPGF